MSAHLQTGVAIAEQGTDDNDGTNKENNEAPNRGMNGFGHIFSGFSVSPAAMPIISVPLKAKFTINKVVNKGIRPFGSQPCAVKLLNKGADS